MKIDERTDNRVAGKLAYVLATAMALVALPMVGFQVYAEAVAADAPALEPSMADQAKNAFDAPRQPVDPSKVPDETRRLMSDLQPDKLAAFAHDTAWVCGLLRAANREAADLVRSGSQDDLLEAAAVTAKVARITAVLAHSKTSCYVDGSGGPMNGDDLTERTLKNVEQTQDALREAAKLLFCGHLAIARKQAAELGASRDPAERDRGLQLTHRLRQLEIEMKASDVSCEQEEV